MGGALVDERALQPPLVDQDSFDFGGHNGSKYPSRERVFIVAPRYTE
jgi:hypothetical protein